VGDDGLEQTANSPANIVKPKASAAQALHLGIEGEISPEVAAAIEAASKAAAAADAATAALKRLIALESERAPASRK
jgi:hypothetical protein